jgi:Uma2 family endonuclease
VRPPARKIRDYFSARSQEVWLLDAENLEVTVPNLLRRRHPGVTVEPLLAAL